MPHTVGHSHVHSLLHHSHSLTAHHMLAHTGYTRLAVRYCSACSSLRLGMLRGWGVLS
jgi:hypothetical protein